MFHNLDLITLKNCQYRRSRRSQAVMRLDIQTLVKVGGGSTLNFFLSFRFVFFFHSTPWQTPFRYSTDAKEVIRNTHCFCKRQITESGERKSINSNRGQQKYDIAGNATRQGDRTEPTAYQGPVVQSIVSLTTSLWRHLVKYMLITFANRMLVLLDKCENLLQCKRLYCKRLSHSPIKHNRVFVIYTFENFNVN